MTLPLTERRQSVLSPDPLDDHIQVRPPFQVHGGSMVYVVGHLPGSAGQDLLPPGIEPLDGNVWVAGMYQTTGGFVLGPYTAFYVGCAVKGHDAPDGREGVFIVSGRFSDRAGQVFSSLYNRLIRPGDVSFAFSQTEATGHAALDDGDAEVHLAARPGPEPVRYSGTSSYLGMGDAGAVNQYTVAVSFRNSVSRDVDLKFTIPKGHRLAALKDFRADFALYMDDLTLTFGAPVQVNEPRAPTDAPVALLDILSRLGSAVAIVESSGRILYLNTQAETLLGPHHSFTLLPAEGRAPPRRGDRTANLRTPPTSLLTLPSGREILATAFPIALRLSDAPAAMVLLTDPRAPGPADPEPLLRLLGLTPSEAALAALIGAGRTPAEAAAVRGITESTARSTLKVIFSKLNLRRQSDLAQIVTRLQMG